MDSLPEFDGMLIARKGEGWQEEFSRFVEYAFASNNSRKHELADFVYAQICSVTTKKEEFEDFVSYVKIMVFQIWGSEQPCLNYEAQDDVPFLCYVFGAQNLRKRWIQYITKINRKNMHESPAETPDNEDDLSPIDLFTKDYDDLQTKFHEEVVQRLDHHTQCRIGAAQFPDEDEIMTGVQLYPEYSPEIQEKTVGLAALKRVTLGAIADCHSEEENREKTPEERLIGYHSQSVENLENYRGQKARGMLDSASGEYVPEKSEPNSTRSIDWELRMMKVEAWSFLCPIHSAEALNDLLLIPYEKVTRRVNLYFNFIADVILPDKKITKRSLTRVIPDDF